MSYTQQTPQRKRRQKPVPQLRVEVRPLLVEGRRRQRRRLRWPHLYTWIAAVTLLVIAVATTGLAVALSGRSGGIRQPGVDLASTAGLGTKPAASVPRTVKNQARTVTHGTAKPSAATKHTAATHTATTHTAATHTATEPTTQSHHRAAIVSHRVKTDSVRTVSRHTTASRHTATLKHTGANGSDTTNAAKSDAISTPNVAVTSTPSSTSSTSTVQDDIAPLNTDMSTSEMAAAAAAATSSFTPPSYLVSDYQVLSRSSGVPWQVLAALSYTQEAGYSRVLGGEQASQVTSAARNSLTEGRSGTNVNLAAQAAAAAAAPNQTLIDDADKLAAAGAATSPGAALATVTDSTATAQDVLTVAQSIGSLAPETTTTLAAATGPEATAASSSSKAYADVPTAAVTSKTAPAGEAAAQLNAMLTEAHLLNELPYVWGGGHEDPAWLIDSGYDCSGFVSEVLHSAGYLDSPDTTQTLPDSAGILSGPGKYVTIYDRTVNTMNFGKTPAKKTVTRTSTVPTLKQQTDGVHMTAKGNGDDLATSSTAVSIRVSPAVQRAIHAAELKKANEADNTINDEHVIIDLDGQWWESGGDSQDGGGEMVHHITSISESYLKSFNLVLHPAGL